jgi:dipeptidase D
MQAYLKHFLQITKIPHCSYHTQPLFEHIVSLSKRYGYDVYTDEAGNILSTKQGAKLTLQAHYDMVCVGKQQRDVVIEDDFIYAKDASLGADNGIGCAMMLALMEEGCAVDCLFTNDEEVGLLGANALELPLKTDKMINLDTEEYGNIYLGCAGGIDLDFISEHKKVQSRYKNTYEVTAFSDGGHSGVDIDKPINNAIIEIAKFLHQNDVEIISFEGGEKINAIPSFCKATVKADFLQSSDTIKVIAIKGNDEKVLSNSKALIAKIAKFQNGVLQKDEALGSVVDSCNFAIICDNGFSISVRSMKKDNLKNIAHNIQTYFNDFTCKQYGKYEPWEPKITPFALEVQKKYDNAPFRAIHAGLECAVIRKKYPHLQIVSIGPDIFFPHSVKEKCNISSCDKIFKLIKTLL